MATAEPSDRKGCGRNRAKTLLRNVIRHTDTHNRRLEEADMWSLHTNMKKGLTNDGEKDRGREIRGRERSGSGYSRSEPDKSSNVKNSFLYDERESVPSWSGGHQSRDGTRRAHMDEGGGRRGRNDHDLDDDKTNRGSSTFWMQKLYKAEDGDEDRWGHAGYKELYPGDFDSRKANDSSSSSEDNNSSSSSESSSSSSEPRHRVKKRKRSSSRDSHRKKKKRKGKKKKKKRMREEDGEDSIQEDGRKKQKHKKQKKEKDVDERKERKKRKMMKDRENTHDKRKRRRK